jgi:uncharacterized protein (DUF1810 family)
MFREKIQAIYEQQSQRLKMTMNDGAFVDHLFEKLYSHGHSPTEISKRCCNELKLVLIKRYEEPIGSNRLDGYGWTRAHIEDHMKRYLASQLEEAGAFLKYELALEQKLENEDEAMDTSEIEY